MVKKFSNDEGVSAVIGVILMVAITVILAAVIAAFVFQMSSNVPKNKQVGVEVKRVAAATTASAADGIISVKTLSGADIGLLEDGLNNAATPANDFDFATYTVTVNGAAAGAAGGQPCLYNNPTALTTDSAKLDASEIGTALYFTCPNNAEVTVSAHFTDGTTTAIWSGQLP